MTLKEKKHAYYMSRREEFISKSRENYRANRGRSIASSKAWREAHRDLARAYHRKKQRAYLEKASALIRQIKEASGCVDCNGKYPFYVLDFDHVRGEKSSNIAHLTYFHSIARLQEEVAKCDVVCANCHRLRTHKRNTYRGK